jgi:type I restriction enzyme S subunit
VTVSLSEVLTVVRNGLPVSNNKRKGGLPISRIETIAGGMIDATRVGYGDISHADVGQYMLRDNDILFSHINSVEHIGKCAIYQGDPNQLVHGMNLLLLRADTKRVASRYLLHALRSSEFRRQLSRIVKPAVNQASITITDLKTLRIPLPSHEEQKRIAAILDKADAIRRKREQAIELADEFLRSLFLDMFGDPVTNPKGWLQRPLGECVSMENGSTPSKDVPAYWGGLIPWVTPKDMKIDEIADSIDHISQRAVEEQRAKIVPVDSVLIVVRGMILAHTVPIARNLAPCTINQDMKALRPSKLLDPVFLASALRCLHNTLLSKVTTSTHGTKKLDSEVLRDLILPVPDLGLQSRFRQASDRACEFRNMALESSQATEILRSSLSNRAFRSEL